MTILYPAAAPVKSSRTARRFGAGILAAAPAERAPFPTFNDAAWWAAESARLEDRHYDRMAALAGATDRHERGLDAAWSDEDQARHSAL